MVAISEPGCTSRKKSHLESGLNQRDRAKSTASPIKSFVNRNMLGSRGCPQPHSATSKQARSAPVLRRNTGRSRGWGERFFLLCHYAPLHCHCFSCCAVWTLLRSTTSKGRAHTATGSLSSPAREAQNSPRSGVTCGARARAVLRANCCVIVTRIGQLGDSGRSWSAGRAGGCGHAAVPRPARRSACGATERSPARARAHAVARFRASSFYR